MEQLNIYQKMLKATEEIQTVAKNLQVGTGKSSYKAVGEADVLEAVKPIEFKYGIYSYPLQREIIETAVLENEAIDYNTKERITKKNLFMRLRTIYRFINTDNPQEYIDITSYGDGLDNADKATGKAMTYSDKYALMKAYKITTGDDPDQTESPTLKGVENKKPSIATSKQIEMVQKLYNADELAKMMNNLHKTDLASLTVEEASKMIQARSKKKE